MNIDFLLVIVLIIILILSALVFFITAELICPDYSRKNKTPAEIAENERFGAKVKKNYPYCYRFITVLRIISFFYPFVYICIPNINVIYRAIGIKTAIYLAVFTAATLFLLISKANNEYENSEFSFREEYPEYKTRLNICLFAGSIVFSFLTVHFTNYALDFSKPEEHIVTVTASVHRTTRGSKGRTNHHYEIYFEPPIRNLNMLDVDYYLQSRTQPHDKLKVYLQNGVFGIPYICNKKIELLK